MQSFSRGGAAPSFADDRTCHGSRAWGVQARRDAMRCRCPHPVPLQEESPRSEPLGHPTLILLRDHPFLDRRANFWRLKISCSVIHLQCKSTGLRYSSLALRLRLSKRSSDDPPLCSLFGATSLVAPTCVGGLP